MLLPSDVARLVLGYLQQEGLCATVQAFVLESPNLKEYSSHSRIHGPTSTCVFSLYGKNLSTILTEYVAKKATESCQEIEVPARKISLWEKLDVTLNQIKCLQSFLTLREDQRCCKKAASGKEAESRTSKMRNMAEPKSSKRRKMAHPIPRASRLAEPLTPSFPFSVSGLETQSGPHPKAQSPVGSIASNGGGQMSPPPCVRDARPVPAGGGAPGPLPLETGTHPDPNEPRDSEYSAEIPRNPAPALYQSGVQEGLRIPEGRGGQNHRLSARSTSGSETDPNGPPAGGGDPGASGKSGAPREDGGQSRCQAAVSPSENTSGTGGTRSHSTSSATSGQPASGCPLPPIKNTRPCGREAPPATEGCPPIAPDATSPTSVTSTASPAPPPPRSASRANPPGVKPEPCKTVTGSDTDDGRSASYQIVSTIPSTEAFGTAEHSVLPGDGHQGATGTTVTASTLQVSPVQPTLQSIMDQKNVEEFTVVPSQILVSPAPSVQSPVKPNPRTEASQKQGTHNGTAVARSPDSATERGPAATPRSGIPSGPGPQSPRRMLCFQVSGRNGKTPKLSLIGQCASGPTFWWIKPPVSEGTGAVGTSGAHVRPPERLPSVCPQQPSEESSVLFRQVAEVLRNIQEQSPSPSPSKAPPPPSSPAQGRDPERESASQHLLRDSASPGGPAPRCSPAADAAARALMVLSRSVVARTDTPPKRSDQQGAPHAGPGRRRLQRQLLPGPASAKELQLSTNGTRVKRQKILLECFPDDVDVDKFLSCLHYDE
ncbi:protein NPAT [Anguilla anguilla]|uniref:protein NPAT n=1 Tax=Anguilla anguilla TaxID=7936 RepID=UPI0015B08580|nr:protein NPAT [Anguilla anguilla]